jgi:peroxiredoxin Q/BCP
MRRSVSALISTLVAVALLSGSYGALTQGDRYARRYTFLIDPAGNVAKVYTSVETSRHSVEVVEDLKRLSKR